MPTATASSKLLEPILQLARHYPATLLDSEPHDSGTQDTAKQLPSLRQQLLDDAGLTQQDFNRPDARFPANRFTQVLSRLAKASDNPHISLRLAEATQPRMLGSTGFLISTSDTLGQALHILEEYLPILFESARLRLEPLSQSETESESDSNSRDEKVAPKSVRLVLKLDEPEQNVAEFFLACLLNWPRWLTGQQIPVQRVELAHSEVDDPARFRQLFAAEVVFNARENAVILPEQYLALPCTDANKELHQLHKAFADALLGKSQNRTALTAQVRHLIREQILAEGEAIRREEVARQLGLSLRTLQRKLGELDTNFQTLYDETRRELCFQLIRKGDLSFGEIAFQLGFSNQSAFQKAFKRWAGMPPSQYRQNLNRAEADPNDIPASSSGSPRTAPFAPRKLVVDNQTSIEQNETISESNLKRLLPEKLQRLNPFGLKTLQRASVIGESFSLKFLSQLNREPEARLMIHLWPAQEAGIIEPLESSQGLPGFRFSHPGIQQAIHEQLSLKDQRQLHLQAGQLLWQERPDQLSPSVLKALLSHLNRLSDSDTGTPAASALSNPDQHQIIELNQKAAFQALSDKHKDDAQHYAQQARKWLDAETADKTAETSIAHESFYHQAKLELYLGDADQALNTLQQLDPLTEDTPTAATADSTLQQNQTLKNQSLKNRILRLRARTLLYLNQPEQALQNLLPHLSPPMPKDEKEQLVYLLNTLEEIQQLRSLARGDNPTDKSISEGDTEVTEILDQLSLMEPVSRLARRQSQPLLAACVISRMAQLCLQTRTLLATSSGPSGTSGKEPDDTRVSLLNAFSRYALVGYAWVASWFCGDYKLSAAILQQGLSLPAGSIHREQADFSLDTLSLLPEKSLIPSQQRSINPVEDYPVDSVAVTDLWHTGQVQHWLEPLSQVMIKLRRIGDLIRRRNDPLLYHEQKTLWYQLASLNGDRSLNRLKARCQQDRQDLDVTQPAGPVPTRLKSELEDAGVLLPDLLQGKAAIPTHPEYLRPLQAANLIRAALVLNHQSVWPELFSWQSRLENDLPGYFMITETLFCLGMMRLILSQQENQTSPRRLRVIDQTESRFELWSKQSPENFGGQFQLLQAEKQRLSHYQDSADIPVLFEQAIRSFGQQGFQAHQALAYERYGLYLQDRRQPILAELCLQKAKKLYQSWGAVSKVHLLGQQMEAVI